MIDLITISAVTCPIFFSVSIVFVHILFEFFYYNTCDASMYCPRQYDLYSKLNIFNAIDGH